MGGSDVCEALDPEWPLVRAVVIRLPGTPEVDVLRRLHLALLLLFIAVVPLLVAAPAHAISFSWSFSPYAGTATNGTITFANVNDPAPTSFAFGVDGVTYTEADSIEGSFDTLWINGVPVVVNNGIYLLTITDTLSSNRVTMIDGSYGAPDTGGYGNFAFAPLPEPSTGVLMTLGLGCLCTRPRPRHPGA